MIEIPEELADLPVARILQRDGLNLTRSFLLIAHTGTGKTLLIPPAIALLTGRKIILRQPTRAAAYEVYDALNKFWGDRLLIGIHTSDNDVGSVDTHDIMVCTDGVLRHWMKNPKHEFTVIFDEIHDQMPVTEIEMGIIKTYLNEGKPFDIVLLSATIRPANIIEYFEDLGNGVSRHHIDNLCQNMSPHLNDVEQEQWLQLYYVEGVAFDVEKRITPLDDSESLAHPSRDTVLSFCVRMRDEDKRGIVFLPTRAKIMKYNDLAREKIPGLTTNFAHADADIKAIVREIRETQPHVLFSTSVFATSVTLPFDECLIVDIGIDTIFQNGIERTITDVAVPNNRVLQCAGRVGRIKPGVCTLATGYRASWAGILPQDVVPPLSKCSPDEFVMTCAQYNLDPTKLDVLAKINVPDVKRTVHKLKAWGIINEDPSTWQLLELVEPDPVDVPPGTLGLTNLGHKVNNLPLILESSVLVARAPNNILPIIIAMCATDDGLYPMFMNRVSPTAIEGIELLDPTLMHPTSAVITRVKILRGAMMVRASDDSTLPDWARMNGMWPKKLEKALKKFYDVCNALRKRESEVRRQLMEMDVDSMTTDVIDYLERTKIFQTLRLYRSMYKRQERFDGDYYAWKASLDGMEQKVMDIDRSAMGINVLGRPKYITKSDWTFVIWKDASLVV